MNNDPIDVVYRVIVKREIPNDPHPHGGVRLHPYYIFLIFL